MLADIHGTFYLKTFLRLYTRPQNRALSPARRTAASHTVDDKRTPTEAKLVTSWSLTALTVAKSSLATNTVQGLQCIRLRKACKQSPCIVPLIPSKHQSRKSDPRIGCQRKRTAACARIHVRGGPEQWGALPGRVRGRVGARRAVTARRTREPLEVPPVGGAQRARAARRDVANP